MSEANFVANPPSYAGLAHHLAHPLRDWFANQVTKRPAKEANVRTDLAADGGRHQIANIAADSLDYGSADIYAGTSRRQGTGLFSVLLLARREERLGTVRPCDIGASVWIDIHDSRCEQLAVDDLTDVDLVWSLVFPTLNSRRGNVPRSPG